MKIYGFTLLRNGVKYDYPFLEGLASLAPIVEKIYLALGDSDDQSESVLRTAAFADKLHLIHSKWDSKLREGGLIMSEQTNLSLNSLRNHLKAGGANNNLINCWGIYLQADEVLHQDQYKKLLLDIRTAGEQGCQAIRFRYLHFWQNHSKIAINKKWYPSEIRAIRLDCPIESWGDAQSFRGMDPFAIFESDVTVFHYGHVRQEFSYQQKKEDILKLYHHDNKLSKYRKREQRYHRTTRCLNYFGSHPLVMKARILRMGDCWQLPEVEEVTIIGKLEALMDERAGEVDVGKFISTIAAKRVRLQRQLSLSSAVKLFFKIQIKREIKRETIFFINPNFWQRLLFRDFFPQKMQSKLARKWSLRTILALKLSEKSISTATI